MKKSQGFLFVPFLFLFFMFPSCEKEKTEWEELGLVCTGKESELNGTWSGKVYNNIANVYYLLNDIEHSYEYYDKALKLAVKENLITEEIKTSSNLVEILFNLEDYDKIDKILNRNLEYFRQIGDPYGIIITLTKIGKLDYLIGPDKFNSSIKNLLEALEIVNRIKITAFYL